MFTTSFSGGISNTDASYGNIVTTIVNRSQNKLIYDTEVSDGNFYTATIKEPNIGDILDIDITSSDKTNKLYIEYDKRSTIVNNIMLLDAIEVLDIPLSKIGINTYRFRSTDELTYNVYIRKDTILSTAPIEWSHVDTITHTGDLMIKFLLAGSYRIDICKVVDSVSSAILEKSIHIVDTIDTGNNKQLLEWE